jgi:hypothetical protein
MNCKTENKTEKRREKLTWTLPSRSSPVTGPAAAHQIGLAQPTYPFV